MATPPWLAAAAPYPALAGQVNQFLGTHSSAWLYSGTVQAAQAIGSGVYQSTAGQYLAQAFTTGAAQSATGVVLVQISVVGGSPVTATAAPLTVGLYADSGDVPSGNPLAAVSVPEQLVYAAPFWVPLPLAASALTPSTTYHLVASPAGGSGSYYVWQQSNQASGAAVSADGISWSQQGFGLMFQIFDQSQVGALQFLVDDGGARWTQIGWSGAFLATLTEVTASQGGAPFASVRSFTYSGSNLTGVA